MRKYGKQNEQIGVVNGNSYLFFQSFFVNLLKILQMDIGKIYGYLNELSRCEWRDNAIANGIKYNGITIEQGTEAYQKHLEAMQSEAEEGILSLASSGQSKVLNAIYRKAKEASEQDYDIITDKAVEALKAEFPIPRTEAIKAEIQLGEFVIEMHSLQTYYLSTFISFIDNLLDNDTTVEATQPEPEVRPTPADKETDKRIIKGVKGLSQALGIGITKTQEILNSSILQRKGVAYRNGNAWRINAQKLDDMLSHNPNIFQGKLEKNINLSVWKMGGFLDD